MNCFYHPDRPAVGICKWCMRALCSEDAAEVEDVLACHNRHEQVVGRTARLLTRGTRVSFAVPGFIALSGALFILMAYYLVTPSLRFDGSWAFVLLGSGFIACAVYMAWLRTRIAGPGNRRS